MSNITLAGSQIILDGSSLVEQLAPGTEAVSDPLGCGLFLRFAAAESAARLIFTLGQLIGVARFSCCHRYEPFWMTACAGTQASQVPAETQFLLLERSGGDFAIVVPLIDRLMQATLQGNAQNELELVAESGDPAVRCDKILGLFVAGASDPYALIEAAARSVAAMLGSLRLRREKPLPGFVEQFGWCTWDAFYQQVSHQKVRAGLQSFAAGGVMPRLLILDDGWQAVRGLIAGQRRLIGFHANARFPGGLQATVEMAKNEYGIRHFLVWHAFNGYWGGVDGKAMPEYAVRRQRRRNSAGVLSHVPALDSWWGGAVDLVLPEAIERFFDDYHRVLAAQGVDGVKVDSQATIEAIAAGMGGRIALARAYRQALESAVQRHFGGNLINCMACSTDLIYQLRESTLLRSSTDFWPRRPESHGLHLYVNAQVSLWFAEFAHPDWDMFQSSHALGAFHGAGRAVSGGPVYVSDKPGEHDFALLRALVLPDGTILRAQQPGRPTRDCLMHDPTREALLLKIFSLNRCTGVLGVFNAHSAGSPISGVVRPRDVYGLAGEQFAVYSYQRRVVRTMQAEESWELSLQPLQAEVFTIVAIDNGIAPIGLAEMFNGGAAIESCGWQGQSYLVRLRAGGRFLAYCRHIPARVSLDGTRVAFTYIAARQTLELQLPTGGPYELQIMM